MSSVQYKGVNLAGLEFGNGTGQINQDYVLPGQSEYNYWAQDVGSNIIRLPFTWERLQSTPGGDLDQEYLGYLKSSVQWAKENGMTIALDLHNYARYDGQVVNSSQLTDVWKKLAVEFGGDNSVWFNLMNEPNNVSADYWADVTQQTVNDLRAAGIDNKMLLSGTSWSGAHSWISSGNAAAYADFVDPMNNFAFDVHQYLDQDSSGFSGDAVPGAGSTRLVDVTEWAEANGFQLFLGEAGVGKNDQAIKEMGDMMQFMEDHSGAWLGWTLWGAGPWWGNYYLEINPQGSEHDPSIAALWNYMKPGAVTEDPVTEDPVTEDPVTEDPVTEDPVTEDPVTEDPGTGITVDLYEGADNVQGTSGNDVAQAWYGQIGTDDVVNLGEGFDTLLIRNSGLPIVDTTGLTGFSGVDHIDITASDGWSRVVLTEVFIAQSDNGSITVSYGDAGIGAVEVNTTNTDNYSLDYGDNRITVTYNADPVTEDPVTEDPVTEDPTTEDPDTDTGTDTGTGSVEITGTDGNDTLYGTAGNDVIYGYNGYNRLYGEDGDDILHGGNYIDRLYGGAGHDTLHGGDYYDRLYGGDGNDTINGDAGNDYIYGEAGDDVLDGGAGNDRIYGDDGNDTIKASSGNDVIYAGAGTDTVVYTQDIKDFVINIIGSTVKVSHDTRGTDTLHDVENFTFNTDTYSFAELESYLNGNTTDDTDTGTGDTGTDTGTGDTGTDTGTGDGAIHGTDGYDTITGTAGDDIIYGHDGYNKLYGESGHDELYGGSYIDKLYGGDGNDTLKGFESYDYLYGGNGDDALYGGADADRLYGESGNDTLYGEAGNDTLKGGSGHDMLVGGAGNDYLYGEDGNDTLIGGQGRNIMYGGDGADTFAFDAVDSDVDYIRDFTLNGTDADALNISDILSGYGEGDDIHDFVTLELSGSSRLDLVVHPDGNGGEGVKVATITGSNFSDVTLDSLIASGQLITNESIV